LARLHLTIKGVAFMQAESKLNHSSCWPRDAVNNNSQTQGNQLQTITTNGKTSMSTALRLEIQF